MAEVPQADPCSECPFKKDSLKGYTGPHEHFVEIIRIVDRDGKFPCHMRVTAISERETRGLDSPDGADADAWADAEKSAFELAPVCTGAIAYANNSCKLVREPSAARYADKIGRRDDVFANSIEAQVYHHGVDDVRYTHDVYGRSRVPRKEIEAWLERTSKSSQDKPPATAGSPSRPPTVPSGTGTTRSKSTGSNSKARSRSAKRSYGKRLGRRTETMTCFEGSCVQGHDVDWLIRMNNPRTADDRRTAEIVSS